MQVVTNSLSNPGSTIITLIDYESLLVLNDILPCTTNDVETWNSDVCYLGATQSYLFTYKYASRSRHLQFYIGNFPDELPFARIHHIR